MTIRERFADILDPQRRRIGTAQGETQKELRELRAESNDLEFLRERLIELELSLEDKGWVTLGDTGHEFSRSALKEINNLARLYWLKNPLVKRAVETQTNYVWGQGINIEAEHPLVNEVVQAFIDDPKNKAELASHQAQMTKETELQCFGNIFFVFFLNSSTGMVRVRTIPMDEIEDIITNPEDSKDPWLYKRTWNQQGINLESGLSMTGQKTAYYPDWKYKPKAKPDTIGGVKVEWETPVYHVAVNKLSDMKFGVSEVYAAFDWAKAYKEFLENWSTIVQSYARFAWSLTTKGKAAGVASAKAKLGTTLKTGDTETNPPPLVASTFIAGEGVNMQPIRTAGATTSAEDGRYLRLMVSSATGIFEHYLTGDPSTGNLATAKAMELPMLIMFKNRQQLWASVFGEILDFVVDCSAKAPNGKLPGAAETNEYDEEYVVLGNDTENENPDLQDQPISRHIAITFPDILEADIAARVNAVVSAATLNGQMPAGTVEPKLVTQLLLKALGIEDIDEIIDAMYLPEGEVTEESKGKVEALMVEAVKRLNEATEKVLAN